jgi:uncharacterized repeat protein (TIGR03837 family)
MQADLFCQVIDHYGDIGVTWRLAKQLNKEHGISLRLWVDDLNVFARIEPRIIAQADQQTIDQIDIRRWVKDTAPPKPYPIVISSFCCPLGTDWLKRMSAESNPCWVELEYLSAEPWVESHHGLSSKRSDGLNPTFFYPGFTNLTAGLIRERNIIQERDAWQADMAQQNHFLKHIGVPINPHVPRPFYVSLFAYPQAPFQSFFDALNRLSKWNASQASHLHHTLQSSCIFDSIQTEAQQLKNIHILIPEGVSLPDNLSTSPSVTWQRIPFLMQADYDKLLWSMNLNVVRGEDSFMRALWAGKPLIWHIYRQTENTHLTKLNAWLARTELPQPVKEAMLAWSSPNQSDQLETALLEALSAENWLNWQQTANQYTQKLAILPDLATNLAHFCHEKTKNTESG